MSQIAPRFPQVIHEPTWIAVHVEQKESKRHGQDGQKNHSTSISHTASWKRPLKRNELSAIATAER
jgi:hypothetical protein